MSAEEIKIIEEKVAGVVNEEIQYPQLKEKYTEWAELYEQDMTKWGYKSPIIALRELQGIIGNKKDARILDVCAGTAMTGKTYFDAGYTNLEAFDGNPAMLEQAKKKNVYQAFHVGFLGESIKLDDNSYDVISLYGALCDGHINPDSFPCFKEFTRIIKPGGYFIGGIVVGCLKDGYRGKVEAAYQALVDDGKWEQVANKISPEGTYEEQIWIYKVK